MSELNHELDRDNVNKDGSKSLGGLTFPSESEHYDRSPNVPYMIWYDGDKMRIDEVDPYEPVKTFWDAFADAVKAEHHEALQAGRAS